MEQQLVRHSAMDVWHIVMMASFSYPHQQSSSLELDLYFHLPNGWCYQADVGSASLAHDEVQTLLSVWTTSFARHLARRTFDEITVSVITTQYATEHLMASPNITRRTYVSTHFCNVYVAHITQAA